MSERISSDDSGGGHVMATRMCWGTAGLSGLRNPRLLRGADTRDPLSSAVAQSFLPLHPPHHSQGVSPLHRSSTSGPADPAPRLTFPNSAHSGSGWTEARPSCWGEGSLFLCGQSQDPFASPLAFQKETKQAEIRGWCPGEVRRRGGACVQRTFMDLHPPPPGLGAWLGSRRVRDWTRLADLCSQASGPPWAAFLACASSALFPPLPVPCWPSSSSSPTCATYGHTRVGQSLQTSLPRQPVGTAHLSPTCP